jgi:hypothetical protein
MRPVVITGVTGTSAWVPLDTYSPAPASVSSNQATLAVEYTLDNVFDLSITPQPIAGALVGNVLELPNGVRAVRGTGMVPADRMIVSQQGIA